MSFVNLLDIVYPIGSVYMSSQSESPAGKLGGSWTQVLEKCIRGASNFNAGGADTVTLATTQIPAHNHYTSSWVLYDKGSVGYTGNGFVPTNIAQATTINGPFSCNLLTVSNTGGGQAHSNVPAYQNMYIWYRTA